MSKHCKHCAFDLKLVKGISPVRAEGFCSTACKLQHRARLRLVIGRRLKRWYAHLLALP